MSISRGELGESTTTSVETNKTFKISLGIETGITGTVTQGPVPVPF